MTEATSEPAALDEARARKRRKWLDLCATVILALGSTLTAWSAFQSAKWSGVQALSFSDAAASRSAATRAATKAGQEQLLDVVLFADWLQALNAEQGGQRPDVEGPRYEPDPTQLSGFLFARLRDELKPAVHAWLATDPLEDPNAPPTPFTLPEYRLASAERALSLERHATELSEAARQANRRSDNYVMTTVFLAVALFFAGISTKLETFPMQVAMNGMAVAILAGAIALLLVYPVAL